MDLNRCSLGRPLSCGMQELRGMFDQRVGSVDMFGTIRDNLGMTVGRVGGRDALDRVNTLDSFSGLRGPTAFTLNTRRW